MYYGLTSAIARIPVGRICDVRGMNPFYLYQSVEFVVGLSTILVTLASDYTTLIVFAVIYGVCDGIFITTLNIIVISSVEGTKRPAALGWQMQVVSIFLASGPPVAGMLSTINRYHYVAVSLNNQFDLVPFALGKIKI